MDAEVWEKEVLLQRGNNRCCPFPHDLLPGRRLTFGGYSNSKSQGPAVTAVLTASFCICHCCDLGRPLSLPFRNPPRSHGRRVAGRCPSPRLGSAAGLGAQAALRAHATPASTCHPPQINKIKGKKSSPHTCRETYRTRAPGAGRALGGSQTGEPGQGLPAGRGPEGPGRRRARAGAGAAPAAPSPRTLHVGLERAEADHDTLHRPQHHADLGRHLLSASYYSSQQPPRRGGKWRRGHAPPAPQAPGKCSPQSLPLPLPLTLTSPAGCCPGRSRPSWQPCGPPSTTGPAAEVGWRPPAVPASFNSPRRSGPGSFVAVEGEGPTDQPVPAPPLVCDTVSTVRGGGEGPVFT